MGFFVKFSGNHDQMGVADVHKAKVQTMFSSSSLYWLLLPPPPTAGGRGWGVYRKRKNILWRRLIAMDKNRKNKKLFSAIYDARHPSRIFRISDGWKQVKNSI
jgi:hypothetical protein